MLENKNFTDVYKELYPDYPNENLHLNQFERDTTRIKAWQEFCKFRDNKLKELGA